MVKATPPSRAMRALQRDLLKTRHELSQLERKAATDKRKAVRMSRLAGQGFSITVGALARENKILRTSLKNFNNICNDQKKTIRVQKHRLLEMCNTAKELQHTAKELELLKKGLRSIECKRNPHIYRKANI